jgi:signal transduction histidine kinase
MRMRLPAIPNSASPAPSNVGAVNIGSKVEETLQHWLSRLSGLRVRLRRARTSDEVFRALSGELIPGDADGLRIAVHCADGSVSIRDAAGPVARPESPPSCVWEDVSLSTVWLRAEDCALGDGGWIPFEVNGESEPPPASCAAIRIVSRDGPGVILLEHGRDRPSWSAIDLTLAWECVRLAEFALSAVDQQQQVLEARAMGDAAAHRWAAFARLSERLARSMEFDDVAVSILTAMVPYLADWAILDVIATGGRLERIGRRHAAPERARWLESIESFPFGSDASRGRPKRLRDGGWFRSRLGPDELRELAAEGEHDALVRLDPLSVAVVPLIAGKQVLGALTLVTAESGQRYTSGDFTLFGSLANQAALALNSARLYRAAERARMEREEVLAIVSHDLRNPLSAIGFALSILEQEGIPEDKKAPQFGVMERALDQMDELVRDLLDSARIDAGRFSVSPVPLDTAALVRDALNRAAPLAASVQVRLEHSELDDLPPLVADRSRLLQVFANLLDNAIDFTPPQGRVHVNVEHREDSVCFEVEDSGPGLEAGAIHHVFDRFWQARDRGRAGAGLGLAIARGIVESHGGEIGVRSVPGEGAVFYFTIPRGIADAAASRTASGGSTIHPPKDDPEAIQHGEDRR